MSIKAILSFSYDAPSTIEELLKLLDQYGDKAKIISGGTDIVPKLKGQVIAPEHVISLKNIPNLSYIEFDEEGLRFGPKVTLRELEKNKIVKEKYQALFEGASSIASTQIRNSATVVGNICNAVPSADSAPALLVLGAKVKIISSKNERIVPIEEFFTGVCKTVVAPNEFVSEIQVPVPKETSKSIYFKFGIRRALDLAMVGVAANITVANGTCIDAKIGLGAVAPTPVRAHNAEKLLIGQTLTMELIEEAASLAKEKDCSPITDMRATKEYRKEMVGVLIRDAIKITAGIEK